jgi:hypothetical protein
MQDETLTIRRAGPADAEALARLAALDSAAPPAARLGPVRAGETCHGRGTPVIPPPAPGHANKAWAEASGTAFPK